LSQDIALSANEDLQHYRAPKCTCREIRQGGQREAPSSGAVGGLSDGKVSLGNGNYWRAPLHAGD
jgi:hypothetical protein